MYDRWFSKEELQQLPFAVEKEALADIWSGLVREVKHLLEQNVSVTDARATDLASRWMERLGAGYRRQTGIFDPPERDAQRGAADAGSKPALRRR